MKQCGNPDCTEVNPEFHISRSNKHGLSWECKKCKSIYKKAYYIKNKARLDAKGREYNMRRRGLSPEAFTAMLAEQQGSCAICRKSNPGGSGNWHIDHNHACCSGNRSCGKCVRGLLCFKCNQVLGLMRDNVDVLLNAIDYLKGSLNK